MIKHFQTFSSFASFPELHQKFNIQYWTPYPESLGTKTFQILGFSGFWIFMQRNFKTDKINNKNYLLRYALSTIHN
jgi:hypothetical protein